MGSSSVLPAPVRSEAGQDTQVPELDGLRGLAILGVLVYHLYVGSYAPRPGSWQAYALVPLRLSWSGVDLFFVLSGFLVGGICLRHSRSHGFFTTFYIRRACRILPLYYGLLIALAICEGLIRITGNAWPSRLALHAPYWQQVLFLQNFWIATTAGIGALNPTWSLAVEEQFYITIPLLISFCPRKVLPWMLGGIAVCAPLSRILLQSCDWVVYPDVLLCSCTDKLAFGVLGAMFLSRPEVRRWARAKPRYLTAGLVCATIGFLLLTTRHIPLFPLGGTILGVFYALLLAHAILLSDGIIGQCLRVKALAYLGKISYGLYLLHLPVLLGIYAIAGDQNDEYPVLRDSWSLLRTLIATGLTLLFADLSWRFLESPLINYGRKWPYYRGSPVVSAVESEVAI
jgi:peptidoglycan/LPS O-acetylase OafA/YrhL